MTQYQAANPSNQTLLLAEGISLAKERRSVMRQLIEHDPAGAIAAAVSRADRSDLPEEIIRELAIPLSARAELSITQSCFHTGPVDPGHDHGVYRDTVINDQQYRVHVFGSRLNDGSLPATSLHGFALDGHFAVSDQRFRIVDAGEPFPSGFQPSGGNAIIVEANGEWVSLPSTEAVTDYSNSLLQAEKNPMIREADAGSGSSGVSGRPSQAWTHGDKSLLVILVDFSDVPGAPLNQFDGNAVITATYINNVINSTGGVREFIQGNSFGKTDIVFNSSTAVTGVLRMPNTASSYATADADLLLHTHARAAALTAGFDATTYDRVAVVFSHLGGLTNSEFTFGGLANVAGPNIWINGAFDFRVMSHELGHTYGLRHSNLWQVPASDPVDLAGSSTEYGDPFDAMGDGDFFENDFSQWNKSLLQWIPDSAVTTAAAGGTFRVYRFDDSGADLNLPRAIKVVRDSTRDYWIGYRRALTSTATDNGAYILWGYNSLTRGNLLDLTTPGSNSSDAPLAIGTSFNDTAAGITITPVTQGGSGADEWMDVTVAFQPRLQWTASNYVVNEQGGIATLTVSRENNSTGAVSVNYSTSAGTAGAGSDFNTTSGTLNWANGDSSPKSFTVNLVADALVEGTETFTVTLSSPSGGVVVDPASATVTIADPGARDPDFNSDFINSSIYAVHPLPDGKILIGGSFTVLQDTSFDLYNYVRIARMNADGTIDTTFDPGTGANNRVRAISRQPDGKILIAGEFTSVNGVSRNRIARLNTDGSLDLTFDPGTGANNAIFDMLLLPDGDILIGGSFTTYNSTSREYLARLNNNGDLDTGFLGPDFALTTGWRVEALARQPDEKILAAGQFYFSGNPFKAGICRIDSDGTLDTSFNGITNGAHLNGSTSSLRSIEQITVEPDGNILIVGSFSAYNNIARDGIARLTSTGALDSGLNPSVTGNVDTLLRLPDGEILIGGSALTDVNSTTTANLALLSSSGNVDTAFAAAGGHNGPVRTFALLPDGNVLLGGDPVSFQGSSVERPLWRFVPGLAGTPGSIQFTSDSVTGAEGDVATVSVSRSGGTLGSLTVGYATTADSATSGADFTHTTGTITWSNGDAADKTFTIPVSSDSVADTPESFLITLGEALIGGALLSDRQQATIMIETALLIWQQEQFTAAELADSLISGDTADPDGDGFDNLLEFAFNTNPKVANNSDLLDPKVEDVAGTDYLTITFQRRKADLGLIYTVESTDDLSGSWSGGTVMVGTPTDHGDGTETVTYRDSVSTGPAAVKRFLRVTVTRSP
ncbi:MAG: hypothetical protein KTR33_06490 [Gammaproteobacteria bacterium]|nr:hypothetical protein [Gammaproteobacteria bacterium]